MSLTGAPLLVLVVLLAVGAPILALLVWHRAGRTTALQLVQRISLLATCQVTAVLLTALLVNNQFALYESWSDLFGTNVVANGPVQPDTSQIKKLLAPNAAGIVGPGANLITGLQRLATDQRVLEETVRGPRSGISAKVWVLLPVGYNDPAQAQRRYPVIVFLPGYPGTPTTWLHALNLQEVADREVSAGRVQPFIAVLPTMNVNSPQDTECTDIPSGPQVDTWLGSDVPRIIASQLRTMPSRNSWGITGYSTGGFCTAKMVLRHPESFSAGAVFSGYFTATTDSMTGDLFGGSMALRHENDPLWLVRHRPTPASSLLAMWSTQDPETATPTQVFLRAVKAPLKVDQLKFTEGGHNTEVWLAALPSVLRWFTAHLH